MTSLAILQVFASFIIGGSIIAILSLLAEKANEKVAGIILTFPTTIVLGFFFLGIATSATKVAEVIPATLTPLGIILVLAAVYIHLAIWIERRIISKTTQIAYTFFLSSIVWFILVFPFAVYKLNNLVSGIAGYFFFVFLAHYLLNRDKTVFSITRLSYSRGQILFRAFFVGSIISIIVLLGKTTGPFWGAIFTMFPAATFAGLMILHFYYPPPQLFFFMRRAPLGSFALFVYAIAAMLFFPRFGIAGGTGLAYLISMVVSFGLIRLQKSRR